MFRTFTSAGRVRHTAWRGLREDRKPDEVIAPGAIPALATATGPAPTAMAAVERPEAAGAPPAPRGEKVTVQVENRRLTISNLGKVLYPQAGFTIGEVINYHSRIAPALLPHLAGRHVTFIRFPHGVVGQQFFEKNVARGAPDWLRTVRLPTSGKRSGRGEGVIEYVVLDELAALVWAANMAALELHVPQWQLDPAGGRRPPDRLVFDLDPGPRTSIVDCCRVAERLHALLEADGLTVFAKTSGSKGMLHRTSHRGDRSQHSLGSLLALPDDQPAPPSRICDVAAVGGVARDTEAASGAQLSSTA